jgi:hypothetical protein
MSTWPVQPRKAWLKHLPGSIVKSVWSKGLGENPIRSRWWLYSSLLPLAAELSISAVHFGLLQLQPHLPVSNQLDKPTPQGPAHIINDVTSFPRRLPMCEWIYSRCPFCILHGHRWLSELLQQFQIQENRDRRISASRSQSSRPISGTDCSRASPCLHHSNSC